MEVLYLPDTIMSIGEGGNGNARVIYEGSEKPSTTAQPSGGAETSQQSSGSDGDIENGDAGHDEETVDGDLDSKETATTAPTGAPTEAPTEAPVTEAPTEAPTEPAGSRLAHGTVDGNTYTNETLNIKFTIPEGWIFYTEEQIAAQTNFTMEMFEGTDAAEALRQAGQLIDMMASKGDGSNANLVIQESSSIMSLYSDKQLFELLKDTIAAQFENSGMEMATYEVLDLPALGEEHAALHLVIKMSGVEVSQYQIWLRDNPDYYGVLSVTSMDPEMEPQTLLDGLSRLHD